MSRRRRQREAGGKQKRTRHFHDHLHCNVSSQYEPIPECRAFSTFPGIAVNET
jgi:hypothetical protein